MMPLWRASRLILSSIRAVARATSFSASRTFAGERVEPLSELGEQL